MKLRTWHLGALAGAVIAYFLYRAWQKSKREAVAAGAAAAAAANPLKTETGQKGSLLNVATNLRNTVTSVKDSAAAISAATKAASAEQQFNQMLTVGSTFASGNAAGGPIAGAAAVAVNPKSAGAALALIKKNPLAAVSAPAAATKKVMEVVPGGKKVTGAVASGVKSLKFW